jgi:2-phospho-L-lactate guanylyltransferase
VATVVVPFRSGGKSRLPAAVRVDLALAMLGDVLEAAAAHAGHVRLVTDDAAAVEIAAALGVEVFADPGGGQGAAVQAALGGVEGACLVVNADLPGATPAALARLEALAPALVAAADGTTNALALPEPAWFAPLYGSGSAARFAALGLVPASIPELEHDVDTLPDLLESLELRELERLTPPLGRRTDFVLNQHKVIAARTA